MNVTDTGLPAARIASKRLLLVVALLAKLALLAWFGPLLANDTGGYRVAATLFRSDSTAFDNVPDWTTTSLPPLAFRPPLYPLLLAGSELLSEQFGVSGTGRYVPLVLVQIALSLLLASLLYDLVLQLTGRLAWPAAATGLYLAGSSVLFDQSLLTDSLFASSFGIVLLRLVGGRFEAWPKVALAALGLLWGASILLRDAGLYFTVLPVLAILVAARRKALCALLFVLPVCLVLVVYAGWNRHRTGEAFVSLTGTANYLWPVMDIARLGYADPFQAADPVSQIARATLTGFSFDDQMHLLEQLRTTLQLGSPLELQRVVAGKLRQTIREHPLAYARFVAGNLQPVKFGSVLFNPLFALNEYVQLGFIGGERFVPSATWKALRASWSDGAHGIIFVQLVALLANLVSGGLFLYVAILLPVRCVAVWRRHGALSPEWRAAALCYLGFAMVTGLVVLIHFEPRYQLPALAPGLAASAFLLARRVHGPARLEGRTQ